MPAVCLYLEVNQPQRLRPYNFFEIGHSPFYLDDLRNQDVFGRVNLRSYRPALSILRQLQRELGSDFRLSLSLSGLVVEQMRQWAPDTLDAFKALVENGGVELLAETYYHSLASLFSPAEFQEQVESHFVVIEREFGQRPRALRNTELLFSDSIARLVADMGFETILAEGADSTLGWRSPNYLYNSAAAPELKVLLRNYRLSDDIAHRFSRRDWAEYPLTAARYAGWLHASAESADCLNLWMDMEALGDYQWADSGIFEFLRALPPLVLKRSDFRFLTVSEAAAEFKAVGQVSSLHPSSWVDSERDDSAWLGASIQREAARALYELEPTVRQCGDPALLHSFRLLQNSELFRYMSLKRSEDNHSLSRARPFGTAHDFYVNYMNVLHDLRQRVQDARDFHSTTTDGPDPDHGEMIHLDTSEQGKVQPPASASAAPESPPPLAIPEQLPANGLQFAAAASLQPAF